MNEKISIITISYNSEKTIEKTFKSVLAQTYRPLEYVLVDGASKDGTIPLIEKYLPIFENAGIEVNFKSESDEGISDAFNKGIERSTGEIIGIINSDDQLSGSDVLVQIAKAFKKNIDVLCGDILWNDAKNNLTYVRKSKMKLDLLKYEMVLMHPACFVRKSAYEKYGVFDTKYKYAMDKDLMSRFYRLGAHFEHINLTVTEMSAGGASDANVHRVFQEGVDIAVKNGVPKWKAVLRKDYKLIRIHLVNFAKRGGILYARNAKINHGSMTCIDGQEK